MSGLTHFRADDHERIFFCDRGRSRPLVVLHGWTASHREWLFLQDELASRARVICWDARGHVCDRSRPFSGRAVGDRHRGDSVGARRIQH
ncbi:MAG: hypothetical protein R3310_10775 [Candidatus Competibacteraceae bacterium]|nr:hypothetical protein [Candidatus Competibacteraceae bacterium]